MPFKCSLRIPNEFPDATDLKSISRLYSLSVFTKSLSALLVHHAKPEAIALTRGDASIILTDQNTNHTGVFWGIIRNCPVYLPSQHRAAPRGGRVVLSDDTRRYSQSPFVHEEPTASFLDRTILREFRARVLLDPESRSGP